MQRQYYHNIPVHKVTVYYGISSPFVLTLLFCPG